MQERSSTLPMCSVDRSTYIPSTMNTNSHSTDSHSSSTTQIHDAGNISNDSSSTSTSTPELNLLLDKLTEILRFRSGCRRHSGGLQPTASQPPAPSASTSNLKRLQSSSIEPLHHTPDLPTSLTGAWKSSATHHKSTLSTRSHHHHHQTNLSVHIHNLDKKRRLPSLLQRLIDEGNLIKEAVRRLKSQKFSQAFKGPQAPATSNLLHTPSTPTTKTSSTSTQSNFNSSSASMATSVPSGQLSDPPSQSTASPSRGISWFLSSSVFGVNASATTTTNHSSGSGSPLRTCYSSSSTHDRTPMEIGIHDG